MQLIKQKNIVILIILIGVGLRLGEYLSNSSFTSDEALTAIRCESISLKDSFFLKNVSFENMQSYPIVFLAAVKLSRLLFGNNELSFRLFSLISSIGSLFLFYFLVGFFLKDEWALLALGLFALSRDMVFMSAHLKPYASDICVALILLLIFISLDRGRCSRLKVFFFALFGILAVYLSIPASIIIFSVTISLIAVYHCQKQHDKAYRLYVLLAIWMLSLFAYYYFSFQHMGKDPQLKAFWASSFFPIFDGPIKMGQWLIVAFKRTFGKFLQYPISLSALFFVCAVTMLWKKEKLQLILLFVPIAAAIALSALRIYPFDGRTIYFLFPSIIILTVLGAQFICTNISSLRRPVSLLAGIFLLFMPILASGQQYLEKKGPEEIKPLIYHLEQQKKGGDIVLVYRGAYYQHQYYTEQMNLTNRSIVVNRINIQDTLKKVTKYKQKQRVWILFTHVKFDHRLNDRTFILKQISRFGEQKDELILIVRPMSVPATLENNVSASLYLYELRGQG